MKQSRIEPEIRAVIRKYHVTADYALEIFDRITHVRRAYA